MRVRHLVLAPLVLGALAQGCDSDDTSDTNASVAPAGSGSRTQESDVEEAACGGVGETLGTVACQTCGESSCCSELEQCGPGSDCRALLDCRGACFDDACNDICRAERDAGAAAADALDACLTSACAEPCPRSDGVCGTAFATGSPACDACVSDSCCAALTACEQSDTCASCLSGFAESCTSDPQYGSLVACVGDACASTCDG